MAPKPDHRIAGTTHEFVAPSVIFTVSVLAPIEFDDEATRAANEISKIGSKWELPNKFVAAKLAILEFVPQSALGNIVALAKRSCAFGRAGLTAGAGTFCVVQEKNPLTGPSGHLSPMKYGGEESRPQGCVRLLTTSPGLPMASLRR
jgi:hypothetical protein